MRKVIYGAATSLDGFIAGPNEEVDWLQWTPDVTEISRATFRDADTVLMGRRTFEAGVRAGMTAFPGMRTVVFSRTLDHAPYQEVEVVRDDAVDYVRAMKRDSGKDIILMGGGALARALLAGGLVDEVGVNVQPIILGGGVPLLPDVGERIPLELIESRVLSGGCVYATYRIPHPGA